MRARNKKKPNIIKKNHGKKRQAQLEISQLGKGFYHHKFTRQPKFMFFGTGLKRKNLLFNFVDEKIMFHQKSGRSWKGPHKKSSCFS